MSTRKKILSLLPDPFGKRKKPKVNEITSEADAPSGRSGVEFGTILPGDRGRGGDSGRKRKHESFLVEDTETMDRARRLLEQDGHRKRARVNAREHHEREEAKQQSLEREQHSNILQHPALNNQRFDGIDPNVNPEPPLNTDARRDFDNERREQDKEKQLKLGNMPKFSTAPKPQGPY